MPAASRSRTARPAAVRPFTARTVQLARALMAAVAALMITFSPDHSAAVGLAVFGGFAIVTSLVLIVAAIIVHGPGQRWPSVLMGAITLVLGMAASIPTWRTDALFFVLVITWAALTGLVELISGIRSRGQEGSRDAITVGGLGLLLAALLLIVPVGFVQNYAVEGHAMSLTGIIIGVGLFGGYAAIVAVFLGIAGLAPAATSTATTSETTAGADRLADHGGEA
ncbi:acyl-CoA synthetase [Microbacterium sp. NPDC077391]|uniref:acyl-CoA synthetase n=1 Tax=unclassified Microbacterium TaxID=2609290 RepID=UPI0008FC5BDE|nr:MULTISPECIES: acyl-CoA synthetase [unclassified Microbacterium]OIU88478.1 acyl-CoA synthetase [Microbacterium sp. AR7-10]